MMSSHLDTLLTPSEPVGTSKMEYSPSQPLVIPIEPVGRPNPAYEKIVIPDESRHKPSFGGLPRGVPYDPVQLCHIALPDSLIEHITDSSNAYARQHVSPEKRQGEIKCADILIFFAIYYYMGIVKLPAKRDHAQEGKLPDLPPHSPTIANPSNAATKEETKNGKEGSEASF